MTQLRHGSAIERTVKKLSGREHSFTPSSVINQSDAAQLRFCALRICHRI